MSKEAQPCLHSSTRHYVFCILIILLITDNAESKMCRNKFKLEEIREVSDTEKEEIVEKHNKLRQKVAAGKVKGKDGQLTKSINMETLKWSDELAKSAQEYADQCLFKKKETNVSSGYVGQNLYMALTKKPLKLCNMWSRVLDFWMVEVEHFSKHSIKPFEMHPHCTEFTQMVWGSTSEVGCGWSFSDTSYPDELLRYQFLAVCHYFPRGNVESSLYEVKESENEVK